MDQYIKISTDHMWIKEAIGCKCFLSVSAFITRFFMAHCIHYSLVYYRSIDSKFNTSELLTANDYNYNFVNQLIIS